jgi:formylglycine-generating enzyme required for sulfatase activity
MWFCGNAGGMKTSRTHEVGTKMANPFGLHDMHGNVYEWCEDVWDEAFYSKPEASDLDPLCASGSGTRIIRGGCFIDDTKGNRSASRSHIDPEKDRSLMTGFRAAFWPLP